MNKAAFDDYIKNRYEEQMSYYAKSSRENRDKYKKFQWALIILSASAPVLVAIDGLKIEVTNTFWIMLHIKIFVVIITASVAILTTALKTFNYFENYVNYRNTREEMKREIHLYDFRIGDYGEHGVHREALFVQRIESILDKEHSQWPASKKLKDQANGKGEYEPVVVAPPAVADPTITDDNADVNADTPPPPPEAPVDDAEEVKP
ncbi:MAG: DUF4231 domain-containing protein [Chitinophagaceae bacterium]|nr:DUF4231 domain-containing protein [Chitinophagaceae bacterium]